MNTQDRLPTPDPADVELIGDAIAWFGATDEQIAQKALAVLAALGPRLLPPGGVTIEHRDCPGEDCRRHAFGQHKAVRTVTTWDTGPIRRVEGEWRDADDA